jgi:UDP-glucose 4-epimerase
MSLPRVPEASHSARVLVTGGAGFIGANLVRLLLRHGWSVIVLDNFSSGRREYLDGLPVQVVEGDILDRDLVTELVPSCNSVIHLAAQTGVPGSLANPRRDCELNVVGTLNVLEACRLSKTEGGRESPRFIFASSNAPLGRQNPPATEEKAPLPISPYGASKMAGEAYCLAYHGSWGIETIVLRFGNVYGPFSLHKNSVVAKFAKDILCQERISVNGDGRQTRDFIYVGDLCSAILVALESDISGEVFQIATGIETSIQDLLLQFMKITGRKFNADFTPARPGDVMKNYSEISKVKRMLDWEPRTPLDRGLLETWNWFQSSAEVLQP